MNPIIGISKDLDLVQDWIYTYLRTMREDWKTSQQLAIVFDIDDTALERNEFGHFQSVSGMLNLFRWAKKEGFKIFFITARVDYGTNRKFTEDQLKQFGFTGYQQLFLMPMQDYKKYANWSKFKHNIRTLLTGYGFSIVLNIGDQMGDLTLLPPFINPRNKEKMQIIKTVENYSSKKQYVIFLPNDVSWVAVKYPLADE